MNEQEIILELKKRSEGYLEQGEDQPHTKELNLRLAAECRWFINMVKKHNYPKDRKPIGPRPTAGRKAKVSNPTRVTVTIELWQAEWLASQGDKSEVIRRLIDEAKAKYG